jgi:hypothetical protein
MEDIFSATAATLVGLVFFFVGLAGMTMSIKFMKHSVEHVEIEMIFFGMAAMAVGLLFVGFGGCFLLLPLGLIK